MSNTMKKLKKTVARLDEATTEVTEARAKRNRLIAKALREGKSVDKISTRTGLAPATIRALADKENSAESAEM